MIDTSLPNVRIYTQSCIRLHGGTAARPAPIVYLDPFHMTEEPHDADYVLITHAHFDHFSLEDIAKVKGPHTELIAPTSMADEVAVCAKSEEIAAVHLIDAGKTIELPRLAVKAVPAYNMAPERLQFHPRANGWLGYVLDLDGVRYYAAGDTDQTPENEQISCDVAFIPIGGTYTMDPTQAAAFVNTIKPQIAVPIHYGSIVGTMDDANTFADAVDPGIAVVSKLER